MRSRYYTLGDEDVEFVVRHFQNKINTTPVHGLGSSEVVALVVLFTVRNDLPLGANSKTKGLTTRKRNVILVVMQRTYLA